MLADLDTAGKRITLLRGGDGGFGNAHFKTSTNRAPRKATKGWPGEERWVWLRLKLIADAGLVGLPNAGKSTFLSVVSAAKPKIADYPFTTLHPQLGVIRLSTSEEFVLADIPGLIEGAHEGAGLGDRFLGHVERCAVLLHLIDGAAGDVVKAWRTVRGEMAAYGGGLADKPEIIGLNKSDAMTPAGNLLPHGGPAESLRPPGLPAVRRHRPGRARRSCAPCRTPSTPRVGNKRGRSKPRDPHADRRPAHRRQDRQRPGGGSEAAAPRTAWLDSVAADIAGPPRTRHRRHRRLLRRHRAGPPHPRPHPEAPETGGKTGRRRGRADPPRAGLDPGAVRAET